MESTPVYQFPFPEPDDYGNGALDLQFLAERINAQLVTDNASYDAILTPPVAIWGLTGTLGPFTVGTTQTIQWTNPIYTTPGFAYDPVNGMSFDSQEPGTFEAGVYVNAVAIGAVNANSYRQVRLQVFDSRNNSIDPATNVEDWIREDYEPNTGVGVFQTFTSAFPIFTPQVASVKWAYNHGNTSSNLNIMSSAFGWIRRIGDLT